MAERGLAKLRKAAGGAKRNGAERAGAALVTDEWSRVAEILGPLRVAPDQLRQFPHAPGSGEEPWDVLLQMLALDEQSALKKLSERTGLPFAAEPRLEESGRRYYERVPPSLSRSQGVAGVSGDGKTLTVAVSQPLRPAVLNAIEDLVSMPVRVLLAPRAAVAALANRGYEQDEDLVAEIVEEMPLDEKAIQSAAGSIESSTDLLSLARQTPVIRLVNMILFEALRRRASDVHIHPQENRLVIRFRVDGMLMDAFTPPMSLAPAISSRLKVMTELDIANRHSPQDGHASVRIGTHKVDMRLSVIPTVYGERTVLRLLDQSQTELGLDEVGMTTDMQDRLMGLVDRPNGILLVTGPTGSGKTTTLYAALGRIDRSTRNVMTVEDPVEYRLEGISQMQVNPKRGVSFATGLRALLRQDPDVILVGEVRDKETAELAIQASLTGHLVLATLHTNDSPSAIPRLVDIGVPPYLVTSTLAGVLAQRLLRRICPTCGASGTGQDGEKCEACFGTGYRGRLAVYEILEITDSLRRLTAEGADAVSLRNAAVEDGFEPMVVDARRKVAQGLTTEHEIHRVLD